MPQSFTFEKFLLLESDQRVQYLKNAFKDKISLDILDNIVETDPTRNNIYTQWLINQYLKKAIDVQDLPEIYKFLVQYDSVKLNLPVEDRDILKIFKLQPGVRFDNQPSVKLFRDKITEILAGKGLDINGNFIGGQIIKKYAPNRFLVVVKNKNYCITKAVESGWCLRTDDYAEKFTQINTGIFLMEDGVAQVACDYNQQTKAVVDIQGRFNKPWEAKYDRAVIDILKYFGVITDINYNRQTFWTIYKERESFRHMVDSLSNLQFSKEKIMFLRKKGIPYNFTPEELQNLTPSEKLELNLPLTEEETKSLSVAIKYLNGIELTEEDKHRLKGTVLGKVLEIIKDDLNTDAIKELFPESDMPSRKVIVDEDGIGVEYKSAASFYEDVYGISDSSSFWLYIDEFNSYENHDSTETEEYAESYIGQKNIDLLKEIFTIINREGLTNAKVNTDTGYENEFENKAIVKFFEDFHSELKSYTLDDLFRDMYYEADELMKAEQQRLKNMLPLGVFNQGSSWRSYVYDYDSVNGLAVKWDEFAKFLGKYKSDIKTLKSIFNNKPVIDADDVIFGGIDLDENFSSYHYTQQVNLAPLQEKMFENLSEFLDTLNDPSSLDNAELKEYISSISKLNSTLKDLGFDEHKEATKNGIKIKVTELNIEDPDNIKVKIKRTEPNGKIEVGYVKIENLYKYFQKTLFEKKFFKSLDDFIKESKIQKGK
jgi:hypothetical protein